MHVAGTLSRSVPEVHLHVAGTLSRSVPEVHLHVAGTLSRSVPEVHLHVAGTLSRSVPEVHLHVAGTLSRSVPEVHLHVAGTLSSQQTTNKQQPSKQDKNSYAGDLACAGIPAQYDRLIGQVVRCPPQEWQTWVSFPLCNRSFFQAELYQ